MADHATVSDDVKIATRWAVAIVSAVVAIASAIGIPLTVVNTNQAEAVTSRIIACVQLDTVKAYIACIEQVFAGGPVTEPGTKVVTP